jgi:hypothetical protein
MNIVLKASQCDSKLNSVLDKYVFCQFSVLAFQISKRKMDFMANKKANGFEMCCQYEGKQIGVLEYQYNFQHFQANRRCCFLLWCPNRNDIFDYYGSGFC